MYAKNIVKGLGYLHLLHTVYVIIMLKLAYSSLLTERNQQKLGLKCVSV